MGNYLSASKVVNIAPIASTNDDGSDVNSIGSLELGIITFEVIVYTRNSDEISEDMREREREREREQEGRTFYLNFYPIPSRMFRLQEV